MSADVAASAAAQVAKPAVPAAKQAALWVGDLAPEVNETTLFNIFSAAGPVSAIRVCRNVQTRESLGYAYVNFQNLADAENAINTINYTLIENRACRIMWSQRDPSARRSNLGNVFVKNLGPEVDSKGLHDTFKLFGNILSCKVATDSRGASKGYGFVHFEAEAGAVEAIKKVDGLEFSGRAIQVMPYLARQLRSGPEWTNLYVKNLPKDFSQKDLQDMFTPFGDIFSSVVSTDANGQSRGFGFVCYKTHPAAQAAVEALNGKEMAGEPVSPSLPRKVKKEGEESSEETAAAAEEANSAPRKLKLYVGRAMKKTERERLLKEQAEAAKKEKQAKWAGCNLYVRNLDETVDDESLKKEFSVYGTIVSARVEKDTDGKSRLFGYVCFSSQEEASKGIQGMNHKLIQGKPLYVQLWQPKDARAAAIAQAQQTRGPRGGAAAAGVPGIGALPPQMAALTAGLQNNPQLFNMMFYALLFQAAQQASSGAAGPAGAGNMAAYYNQLMTMQRTLAARGGAAGALNPAALNPAIFQQAAAAAAAAQGRSGSTPGFNPMAPFMALFQQQQAQAAQAQQVATAAGQGQARAPRRQAAAGAAPAGAKPSQQRAPGAAATGPRPAVGAPRQQAAGVAGGKPSYRNVARNADGATTEITNMASHLTAALEAATASVPASVQAAAPSAPVSQPTSFATLLANATPENRKNMIGERLYPLIAKAEPTRAGKITGMLLEGMEEGELLHLLEAPEELQARIAEALEVLISAEKQ